MSESRQNQQNYPTGTKNCYKTVNTSFNPEGSEVVCYVTIEQSLVTYSFFYNYYHAPSRMKNLIVSGSNLDFSLQSRGVTVIELPKAQQYSAMNSWHEDQSYYRKYQCISTANSLPGI